MTFESAAGAFRRKGYRILPDGLAASELGGMIATADVLRFVIVIPIILCLVSGLVTWLPDLVMGPAL